MAFQSPTAPGRRAFLELQNETKSSLAYRSHSDLSSLCRSVGIPSEGTSSELITRLLSLKLSNDGNRAQTSTLSTSLEQSFNNDSWLNRSGNFLDEEESFGISKLNLNDHSGSNHSNFISNGGYHPLPIPPIKQPIKNSSQAPYSPSFPDVSKYEKNTQPTNHILAASKPSPHVLGSHPDYINQQANIPSLTVNNPFTEQAKLNASKIDNKAEHISLTIETDESSQISAQKSPTIPFPFPLKEEPHFNPHNTGVQNNNFSQAGSLPKISQLSADFTNSSTSKSSREQDPFAPSGQIHNPFLKSNEVPIQQLNTDPFLIQNTKNLNSPALIQKADIDSDKNNFSNGTFSPVNVGSTQGAMPWIQMNWGSPPAHQGNHHQSFYNQKTTPPNQGHSPNHIIRPNKAQQNSSEFRNNYYIGQTSTVSPPPNGGFPYNPFEKNRKTSLVPEQRQNIQPIHQKIMPDQGVGYNGYQGQHRNIHPGQEFLQNQSNLNQNGVSPSYAFVPNQPAGNFANLGHDQSNARSFSQDNLINLTSPPEQIQRQNPINPNLHMANFIEPPNPLFNLSPVENTIPKNFIPQEIMTQSSHHVTAGKSLLFQSLWDHDGSHPDKKKEGTPLQEPTSFSPSHDSLIQHSQMTSPESAMTSGFNSYTSQGFENPISITTDWAASPRTSDVMPPDPVPNPAPVPVQAPAQKNLLPITQIEELLIQETGESISLIPFADLQIGRQIGTGGYKDCFAGTYKGEIVAIGELKVTQFTREDFLEIKNEVNVLKQVYHENIVRFIGIAKGPEKLCILTEFCQKGDLFDQFRRDPKPSFEKQIQIMYDIALGVAYLHARRPSIIHRDLKSMNILINKDGKAKINDFGLARIRSRVRSIAHTQCGTPNWQAPEIFAAKPSYTEKVDVYAVGLIFWEILQWGAQPFPFSDIPESSLEIAIRDKRLRPSFNHIQACPTQLYHLIVQMWDHEATARPSMAIVVDQLGQLLD